MGVELVELIGKLTVEAPKSDEYLAINNNLYSLLDWLPTILVAEQN